MWIGILFLTASITVFVLMMTNVIPETDSFILNVAIIIIVFGVFIMSLKSIYNSYQHIQSEKRWKKHYERQKFEKGLGKMEYGVGLTNINIQSKVYPESKKSI